MDIGGMALGFAGEIASAAMGQRYQTELQHGAQDFASQQFGHRYQTTVADLKAAGLNLMLAYQQGGGNAPVVGAGSGAKPDYVSAMNNTRLATAQEAKTNQDTKVQEANEQNILWDTATKKLQPALVAMQTMNERAKTEYTQNLTAKIDYEIQNLVEQRDEIISQVHRNNADANLKQQQVIVERTMAELNVMKTILTQAGATGQKLENIILSPKAKAAQTVTGETAAQAENVKRIIQTVTDPVSDVFRSFKPFSRQTVYPKKAGD